MNYYRDMAGMIYEDDGRKYEDYIRLLGSMKRNDKDASKRLTLFIYSRFCAGPENSQKMNSKDSTSTRNFPLGFGFKLPTENPASSVEDESRNTYWVIDG